MTSTQTFEKSITELEQIVETLEKGDLSLDETLKKFEEGMKLSQFCQQSLNDAQQKINQLINESEHDDRSKPNT
jgi:exodeoxyribonuclease VII small subunit